MHGLCVSWVGGFLTVVFTGALASAADPAASPSPAPSPSPAAAGRQDPTGQKGISPFWQLLGKGDAAYLARDFEAAIGAYREAITQEPKNPLGHYRIGQAHCMKGDLKEAQVAYEAGVRFVKDDPALEAKLFFVLADLAERQKAYDDALVRWKKYADFVGSRPVLKAFGATAVERARRVTEWTQLSEKSAQVRERVQKRLQEVEAARSAKGAK